MCLCRSVCIGVFLWNEGCVTVCMYIGKDLCMYRCVIMEERMCQVMDICR